VRAWCACGGESLVHALVVGGEWRVCAVSWHSRTAKCNGEARRPEHRRDDDLALISPERIANRISSAVIFIHRSDGSQCTAARLVPLDGLGVVEQCRSARWDVISARSLLTAQQAGEDGLCRAANRLTPA